MVGCGGGHEEPVPVAGRHAPDDTRAGDGALDERDQVGEFSFEDAVEGGRTAEREEAVAVGQRGEHADFVAVFEVGAHGHDCGCCCFFDWVCEYRGYGESCR